MWEVRVFCIHRKPGHCHSGFGWFLNQSHLWQVRKPGNGLWGCELTCLRSRHKLLAQAGLGRMPIFWLPVSPPVLLIKHMIACISRSPHVLESFIFPDKVIWSKGRNFFFSFPPYSNLIHGWPQGPKTLGTQRHLGPQSEAGFSFACKAFEKFCLNFV